MPPEFTFDPPLTLKGNAIVRTLDDAADYLRAYRYARKPLMQENVLRRLERADSLEEQRDAANAFRGWVEAEGLLQMCSRGASRPRAMPARDALGNNRELLRLTEAVFAAAQGTSLA